MWKKFLIRLAFSAVCEFVTEWALRKGKPWALDFKEFCHELKSKI